MPNPVSARIESIEGDHLLLKTTDGQSLSLPTAQVYGPVIAGGMIRLFVVSQSNDGVGDEALSQAMINELLHPAP